jgi:predicted 3-demethylubiquinone-9 3-methyltransferase (glyoxalase superfamily)
LIQYKSVLSHVNLYISIFNYISTFNGSPHKGRDSKIISLTRYEKGMEVPGADQMEGKVLTAIFELNGQSFMAFLQTAFDQA